MFVNVWQESAVRFWLKYSGIVCPESSQEPVEIQQIKQDQGSTTILDNVWAGAFYWFNRLPEMQMVFVTIFVNLFVNQIVWLFEYSLWMPVSLQHVSEEKILLLKCS